MIVLEIYMLQERGEGGVMQSLEAFGKRIRALRQEKNLSQQQLADLMFVTRKTGGNWENGNRMPDITMLSRLSRHLGVQTYELLDAISGCDEQPMSSARVLMLMES